MRLCSRPDFWYTTHFGQAPRRRGIAPAPQGRTAVPRLGCGFSSARPPSGRADTAHAAITSQRKQDTDTSMRARQQLLASLQAIVKDMGLSWPEKATLEPPRDKSFGDLAPTSPWCSPRTRACPHASWHRAWRRPARLRSGHRRREIAGPGFLNVTYSPDFWRETVLHVEAAVNATAPPPWARPQGAGGIRVRQPHRAAAHRPRARRGAGRLPGAGAAFRRVHVTTEYYINDAGRQMRLLGLSVWLRRLELSARPFTLPEDSLIAADYIKDIAARRMLGQRPVW